MFETETSDEKADLTSENPYRIPGSHTDLRPPPDSMHQALFSIEHSKRFIHEVLTAHSVATLLPVCIIILLWTPLSLSLSPPTVCVNTERV